jgi:hypothetical protein
LKTPLVNAQAIGTRRFGVELEFHFKGLDRYESMNRATTLLAEHGFNVKRGELAAWNNVGQDGSGCEVRSPILKGAVGLRDLRDVVTLFVKNKGNTNTADGLHVHHDAPEFVKSRTLTAVLVESWKLNEAVIDAFVARRRRGSGACSKWRPEDVERLKSGRVDAYQRRWPHGDYGPRGAINIGALVEHGTIEIRLHEGTLDYKTIESWIIFGQRFLDTVANEKALIESVKRQLVLLERLGVPRTVQKRLVAKARKEGLLSSRLTR